MYVHLKCVTVRRDILLGIKHETRYHQYDPTEPNVQLTADVTDEISYTDGELFDETGGFTYGTTRLNGPCQYLKASVGFDVRDSSCESERGFICQWRGE